MPRIRGRQRGKLTLNKNSWSGRARIYYKRARGGEAVKLKSFYLGPASMTREEATEKLRLAILEEQARRDHMAFVGLPAGSTGPMSELDTRRKGMIAEMLVAMDLTRKGFEIYRHMSDMAPCDMIAVKDERILRVEVKFAGSARPRYICFSSKFDVLAVVAVDESISYESSDDPENRGLICSISDQRVFEGEEKQRVSC